MDGLAAALEAAGPGRFVVRYGAKYTAPTIEEGMADLVAAGVDRVVGIVLTPHQSSLGSGEYFRRAARPPPPAAGPVRLIAGPLVAPGRRVRRAAGRAHPARPRPRSTGRARDRTAVFFTAHSLPLRVVAEGDPYPDQVAESAADIAGLLGLDDEPDADLGGGLAERGADGRPVDRPRPAGRDPRVAAEGATAVVVCPVGFVSDHLEVLYDLDIEAAGVARSAGVAFARTPSLNDDPALPRRPGRGGARGADDDVAGAAIRGRDRVGTDRRDRTPPADRRRRRRPGSPAWPRPGSWSPASDRAGDGRRPRCMVLEAGDRIGGKLRAGRVRRSDGRPGRRRLPGPPARGHRALRRARPGRPAGPGRGIGRLHLGPGPAPAHARRAEPRRAHPVVAAGPVGDPQPGGVAPGGQGPGPPHRRGRDGLRRPGGRARSSAERLGRPVVDRLVDPLIGGINAGASTSSARRPPFPVLIAASHQPGSLMRRLGRVRLRGHGAAAGPPGPAPVFWSLAGSTASLAEQLAESAGRAGGRPSSTGSRVEAVERRPAAGPGARPLGAGPHDTGRAVDHGTGAGTRADPDRSRSTAWSWPSRPAEAAVLLARHAPVAAGMLSTIGYASVAVVTLSLPPGAVRAPLARHRLPRAPHLDHRRPAGPDHRVHLPGPEVAAPGPARGRAGPGLGGHGSATSASTSSTTTS